MIYLYDGTYHGFLSVVYANYYEKRATEVIVREDSPGLFLDESKEIVTDSDKARKVEKALLEQCGKNIMSTLYYAFHADTKQKDSQLLRFVEVVFRLGNKAENALIEPAIAKVYELSKRVSRERHKFLGFVRFEEILSGEEVFLYSPIEPENNILPLLGKHFAERFYKEKIIIHDKNRKTALIAYHGEWEMLPFTLKWQDIVKNQSQKEKDFQKLWQGYFKHIAIEERFSKKRQQQFVPLRYRNHLTEFQKEIAE